MMYHPSESFTAMTQETQELNSHSGDNQICSSPPPPPSSSSSSSSSSSFSNWSTTDLELLKQQLISSTLSMSDIVNNFKQYHWRDVIKQAISISNDVIDNKDASLVAKEKIYVYQLLYNSKEQFRDNDLAEKTQKDLSMITDIFKRLNWNNKDIEKVISISHQDLTKTGLTRQFPQMDSKDLIRDLKLSTKNYAYPMSIKELELIKHRQENVYKECFLRSRASIEELLSHSHSSFNGNHSSREEILKNFSRRASPEFYDNSDKSAFNEFMQKNKKEFALLKSCVQSDLTLKTLTEYFPQYNISEIADYIKDNNLNTNENELTGGEKKTMREFITLGKQYEEILHEFPLRSESCIANWYKRLSYACSRQVTFKNKTEKLIYESGMALTTSRRASRRSKAVDFDELQRLAESAQNIKVAKKVLTEEEKQARAERKLEREQEKERKRLERLEQRAKNPPKPKPSEHKTDQRVSKMALEKLIEATKHFQSVTGDRQILKEGVKRKIIPATFYTPEIKVVKKTRNRQEKKNELRKKLKEEREKKKKNLKSKSKSKSKQQKTTKRTYKRRKLTSLAKVPGVTEYEDSDLHSKLTSGINIGMESEEEEEEEEEDEEEEEETSEHISPFDPPDINSDTLVDLHGRKFFVKEFYSDFPRVPELNFQDQDEKEVDNKEKDPKDSMTRDDDTIPYIDELGAHVIGSHEKCYRDMPISFPQYSNKNGNPNHSHAVKVRFLLYPEHYESYILAEPKDNELDPVHEIMKIFLLHYALYFSHSENIKEIITDYCQKLERAVEENDFAEFMFVVDKWNLLMLYLSPNTASVEKVLNRNVDINANAKECLNISEIKNPQLDDLDLETFYGEICFEITSPFYQPVEIIKEGLEIKYKRETGDENENKKNLDNNQNETKEIIIDDAADISINNVEPPLNISEATSRHRPRNYISDFFTRLQLKSSISRYAVHQILCRVYARVVSTDSRKLRSYKAFTAEVYGELLPSFTSEVLEKVGLKPGQKFYDLGSGVGNTTFQAALEFGAISGGCELMKHASKLTKLQDNLIRRHLAILGIRELDLKFALSQSFVANEQVRRDCLKCDVLIINNYLFDGELNASVGKLLLGLKPGTKIISLRNFISPRYRAQFDTVFDYLSVVKEEMSDLMSVSWTANKVPYYISTVEATIRPEYLRGDNGMTLEYYNDCSKSTSPLNNIREESPHSPMRNSLNADGASTPPTEHNSDPEFEKS